MSGRRRNSHQRNPDNAVSPEQIRAQLNQNYLARQTEWRLGLAGNRVNWAELLALHLQMTELEHLTESLEEFA
jgi:hypothetical protein